MELFLHVRELWWVLSLNIYIFFDKKIYVPMASGLIFVTYAWFADFAEIMSPVVLSRLISPKNS